MVRLSAGAVVMITLAGCSGLIDGNSGSSITPEERVAREKWVDKALPVFRTECMSCHAGTTPEIAFFAGGDDYAVRDTVLGWDPQVANLEAPQSSRLVTKGAHSGPALLGQETSDVLEWLQAEHDAAGASGSTGPTLAITPFTPLLCTGGLPEDTAGCGTGDPTHCCPVNHVDLGPLGLTGATIDFVAQPLSQDLYVTDLYLKAAADGAYIEHPLFVSNPTDGTDPIPDTLDRFFNVKMNLMAGTDPVTCPGPSCDAIGGGTAAFVNFSPINPLSIHFKVVDKYHADTMGGGGGDTGGCKQLDSFKMNAQAALNTNCASCHTGNSNANAKSAMDLTGIASTDDMMILQACNQARTRVNFQTIDQSGFFIAPDPNSGTNHPFKFAAGQFQPFHDAVVIWANAEKTSQ